MLLRLLWQCSCMKRISVLRHGKSSWDQLDLKDIDRPLLEKGKKRTQKIAKYMKENGIFPDCIISSPASRALETTNIVIEELKLSLIPQISKKLYPGRVEDILDKISALDKSIKHVLIVGHNPVLSELINEKSDTFSLEWLPTSAIVTLNFEIKSWDYILAEKGDCIFYGIPKKLNKH